MDILLEFLSGFVAQLQGPVLAFLLAGMAIAAFNSKLQIPDAIYQFCVFVLLMRIGIKGGMSIKDANIVEMLLPALFSVLLGVSIVFLGVVTLAKLPGVKKDDALATLGLFGAVSGSTLAVAMIMLEEEGIFYEAWVPALYPFMDIPALILAIVLANMYLGKKGKKEDDDEDDVAVWPIVKDCFQGSAITALILGIALGILSNPERVFEEFYDPLFRGFLSVLMLIMGMEAYQRIKELKSVAHWYIIYAVAAPIVHGFMGFGLGYIAHILIDFSPGAVIIFAIIAASNSDISGPPTIRAGIPSANPSIYIATSTGVGTVVTIGICIPLFLSLGRLVFNI